MIIVVYNINKYLNVTRGYRNFEGNCAFIFSLMFLFLHSRITAGDIRDFSLSK